jgi:hypothetical protein
LETLQLGNTALPVLTSDHPPLVACRETCRSAQEPRTLTADRRQRRTDGGPVH